MQPGAFLCEFLRVGRKLRVIQQQDIARLLLPQERFIGIRDIFRADNADGLRGNELVRNFRLFVVPVFTGIKPAGFSSVELFQRVGERIVEIQLALPGIAICVFIIPDEIEQRHGAQRCQADLRGVVKKRGLSRFEYLQTACRRSVVIGHTGLPFKKKPRTGLVRGFYNKITVLRRQSTSCDPCPYART